MLIYSYGSLVETMKAILAANIFGIGMLSMSINLDVNIENCQFRKSVFVNSKMRNPCRLSKELTILVSRCSNLFLVCYFHF